MSLTAGRTKLHTSLDKLTLFWEELKPNWNDPVRRDFEENHWVVMEEHVLNAIRAIDRLDQVLARLKYECS